MVTWTETAFPILFGVDVSYDTLPVNLALCFVPWQLSLRRVVPDVIHPLALRTSSPSLPRHLYHHHYLAHTFFFSSQYTHIPLQTSFLHFLGYFSNFAIPLILLFLILSTLVTPLISFPTYIVVYSLPTYIGFCPCSRSFIHIPHYHYIIIWRYLLPQLLRLHTSWRGTLSHAFSRAIYILYSHVFRVSPYVAAPRVLHPPSLYMPGMKPKCASINLLSIIISKIFKVYQLYPSAIPHNPGCFTPLYKLIQSDYLSTPLIIYTLCIRLITCQSLPLPNTYTHPLESHPFPLSLLSPFVHVILT